MKSKAYDKLIQHRLLELVLTPWQEQKAFKEGIINEHGAIIISHHRLSAQQKRAYPSSFYASAWSLKQILEARNFSLPKRVGMILSKLYEIRERVVREDIAFPRTIDEAAKTILAHYGIEYQPMLEENYDALPLIGEYEIRGKRVDFQEPLMPIGDMMGFPMYENEGSFFTMLEARKMKNEDGMGAGAVGAPANNVGGGNIAGVSPGQEPPGPKGGFKSLAKAKKKRIAQLRRDAKTLNVVATQENRTPKED